MYLQPAPGFVASSNPGDQLAVCFSDEIGLGVQALVDFAAGDVLDRFTGAIGAEITQHSLQVAPDRHISETRFIGYLTHGCDPNSRLDMARFELIARRDIAVGELLTIDYAATEDVLHVQFACRCGAGGCRRWITGRADAVNADGRRHLAALFGELRPA